MITTFTDLDLMINSLIEEDKIPELALLLSQIISPEDWASFGHFLQELQQEKEEEVQKLTGQLP